MMFEIRKAFLHTREQVIDYICNTKETFYVYALVNPVTRLPFYVGKGQRLRCIVHWDNSLLEVSKGNPYKNNHLKKLRAEGLEPLYFLFNFFDDEDLAYQAEENLINKYGLKLATPEGLLYNLMYSRRSGAVLHKKPVFQYSLSGEFIAKFDSYNQAGFALNLHWRSIRRVCLGLLNSTGGFRFSPSMQDGLPLYKDQKTSMASFNSLTKSRPVIELNNVFKSVRTFKSQKEAMSHYDKDGLYRCLAGSNKTFNGSNWMWLDDWEELPEVNRTECAMEFCNRRWKNA